MTGKALENAAFGQARKTGEVAEEFYPYIVYRLQGSDFECALWQLAEGQKALALFSSNDAATAYVSAAALSKEWRILRPPRDALLQLVRASAALGVGLAVLDPDGQKAKRLFNLQEILLAVDALGPPG